MGNDLGDALTNALIARKIRKTIEEGNRIRKEQLGVLREIRDRLKA